MGSAEMLEEESLSPSCQCASCYSQGRQALDRRVCGFPTAGERALLWDRGISSAFSDSCEIFTLSLPTYFPLIPSSSWDWVFVMTNLVLGADKIHYTLRESSHFILLSVSHKCGSCWFPPKRPSSSRCFTNTELLDLWSWWRRLWR